MTQLQIFKNNQFGEVRVATNENNESVFCLSDLCRILGLVSSQVMKRLEKGVVSIHPLQTAGGIQQMNFVNEDGLCDVILDSRKQEAKAFRKWVTSEVLPSIRKHGAYLTNETIEQVLTDPDTIIKLATALKEERQQKEIYKNRVLLQEDVIKSNAPKVQYYEEVLQSQTEYTTTQIAKELGLSTNSLNDKLRKLKVQYKVNGTWVLTSKYQSQKYTGTKTHHYLDKTGVSQTSMLTVWTEKGRLFIHSLLKSA